MFLTAFVYEFFLYNSLYQVDWPASSDSGALAYLASEREDEKQAEFENFLKSRATADLVRQAFRDLEIRSIEGAWVGFSATLTFGVDRFVGRHVRIDLGRTG